MRKKQWRVRPWELQRRWDDPLCPRCCALHMSILSPSFPRSFPLLFGGGERGKAGRESYKYSFAQYLCQSTIVWCLLLKKIKIKSSWKEMNLERTHSFHSCFPEYFSGPNSIATTSTTPTGGELKSPQDSSLFLHGNGSSSSSSSSTHLLHCVSLAQDMFHGNPQPQPPTPLPIPNSSTGEFTTQQTKPNHLLNPPPRSSSPTTVAYHCQSSDNIASAPPSFTSPTYSLPIFSKFVLSIYCCFLFYLKRFSYPSN